jgi:hypothetical protein
VIHYPCSRFFGLKSQYCIDAIFLLPAGQVSQWNEASAAHYSYLGKREIKVLKGPCDFAFYHISFLGLNASNNSLRYVPLPKNHSLC